MKKLKSFRFVEHTNDKSITLDVMITKSDDVILCRNVRYKDELIGRNLNFESIFDSIKKMINISDGTNDRRNMEELIEMKHSLASSEEINALTEI